LAAALAVNVLLGVVGYHYDVLYRAIEAGPLARRFDPYARLRGWRELAAQVHTQLARHPGAELLGDDRAVLAELGYYLHLSPAAVATWNPSGRVSDQYRLSADVRERSAGEYLFVARGTDFAPVAAAFARAEDLGTIHVPTHRDSALECRLYLVQDFRGYPP
jgi:hypothetical protein